MDQVGFRGLYRRTHISTPRQGNPYEVPEDSGLLDFALPVVMFGLRQPSQSRAVKGFDTFSFHHIRFASTFRQPR